jgi:phage gp46-like protein
MSDLYMTQTPEGGDIEFLPNNDFRTTDGLGNAVYFSLFTPSWWGNALSEPAQQYGSRIPALMRDPLTNRARRNVEIAAEDALAWMKSEGIADRVEAEAFIRAGGRLDLRVTIHEPKRAENTPFAYSLNWDSHEVIVR